MSAVVQQPELVAPPHGLPRTLLAFERVVVVIDPSVPHQAGLDKAARIAARTGAKLELCIHEPMKETVTDDSAFERQFGHHVIRTLPDLVIKEVHGQTGSGPTPTRTDWQLMRQLAAPLLLVGPEPWPERLRMTVCLDPCHPAIRTPTLDQAMLESSVMLGEALDAELGVLHVLDSPPHLPGEPVAEAAKRAHHAQARAVVQSFLASAGGTKGAVPAEFTEGAVAASILGHVRERRAQVLTLGFAPRAHWVCADSDGITGEILEAFPCDLLITKPPGFVSPLLATGD